MHEPATCTLLLLAYSKSSAVKQLFVHRYRAAMKWQLRRRSVTYTTVLKPTSQPRCRRFQYQTSYVSNVKKRATTTPSHFGRAWKSINPSVRHYIVTRNAHDISWDAISRKSIDTATDRVSIYQFTQIVTTKSSQQAKWSQQIKSLLVTTDLRSHRVAPLSRTFSCRLWILSAGSRNAATGGLLVGQSCHVHEDFWTWEVYLWTGLWTWVARLSIASLAALHLGRNVAVTFSECELP